MKSNRLTFDDLMSGGEKFDIAPDKKGKLRVIKKKQPLIKPELYRNESELKKAANNLLEKLPRCKLLRTDNMALMVGSGKKVKTRNPGMSDHHLCLNGFFVAIEAKMPGKTLDPDQVIYRKDILAAGGIFIEYHSLHELIEELKKYRLVNRSL